MLSIVFARIRCRSQIPSVEDKNNLTKNDYRVSQKDDPILKVNEKQTHEDTIKNFVVSKSTYNAVLI